MSKAAVTVRCDTTEELVTEIEKRSKGGVSTFVVEKWCDHYALSHKINIKGEAESWNGRCTCGHLHSEHHPTASVNYSAGMCTVGECRCKHFIHNTQP